MGSASHHVFQFKSWSIDLDHHFRKPPYSNSPNKNRKVRSPYKPITLETLHFWAYKIHSSTGVRSIHMTLKTLPIPVGIFQILYLMIVFLYMFFPFPYSTWVLSRSKSVPKDEQSDHEIVTDLSRVLNCAYHPLVQHINGTSWYRSTV